MELKILTWLRALAMFALIILAFLHFKSALLSAMTIDLTKLSAIQLISYEWIIPFISFYALLSRRDDIARAAGVPSWIGFGFTCFFLTALSMSAHTNKPPFQLLSIAGVIFSVSYAFWGKEAAKLLWFPMSFLVFAVPVFFYLECLKAVSDTLPDLIMRFGTAVEQFGFKSFCDLLELKGFSLNSASPSRGVHSLFAMLAIASTFAHFTVKTRPQRLALFCFAIPVTIIANLFCMLLICLIALKLDRQWALTFYAHYSQYLTFIISVLLIFKAANVIVRFSEKFKKPTATDWLKSIDARETQSDMKEQSFVKSVAIVFLVLIVGMLAFFFTNSPAPDDTNKPAAQGPSIKG
jgi:exosortase/archaeosortase family protein